MKPYTYSCDRDAFLRALARSNLTQTELAASLRISKQALYDIITGRAPGHKHRPQIAGILETPVDVLWPPADAPQTPYREENPPGATIGSSSADFFLQVVRDSLRQMRQMRDQGDRDSHQEALSHLPSRMQRWIQGHDGPPGPLDEPVEQYLTFASLGGNHLAEEDQATFREGYVEMQRRRPKRARSGHKPKQVPGDLSLPMSVFRSVRGALKVVLAERSAFNRPHAEITQALTVLWERQMTYPWNDEVKTLLEKERTADLPSQREALHDQDTQNP